MFKKLCLLAAIVLVGSEVFAIDAVIRGVRLTGSGCEASTATASITPDGQILSVLFDNYSAEIGTGSVNPNSTVSQKDCHILIDMDVPFGQQYALQQTDYRGFAALPANAFGFHRFTQIIPGAPIASMREAQLKGPTATNYEVSIAQKPGRMTYSPCNQRQQTVDLFSQLMVSYLPNTRERMKAQINLDSTDTNVNTSFRLNWRACR